MLLLLSLCLMADGGTPPVEPALELTVYRAAKDLPREWMKVLPADFDFRTESLAIEAGQRSRVQVVLPARVERREADLFVWPAPRARACPPCQGIARPRERDWALVETAALVFRIPRVSGKVLLMPGVVLGGECFHCKVQ